MRTYKILNWNKPNYDYNMQIEDCEKGKIISFIRTTTKGIGYAKQIDRVAVSTEALNSLGLTEENLVKKLQNNGELRSILKFGEDIIWEGAVRTSRIFLSLHSSNLYVSYESLADQYRFDLPLSQKDYNSQHLEKIARTLDYTDRPLTSTASEEPAIANLKKAIYKEDFPIVGNVITDIEKTIE